MPRANAWAPPRPSANPEFPATYLPGRSLDEHTAAVVNGQTLFFHQNAIGNVFAVSDATGAVTVLAPDGSVLGGPELALSPYLFTGRPLDLESGLYYFRNRYYSPTLGRFISPDPLDYVDGMNVYAYVNGNVVNLLDPMGTEIPGFIRNQLEGTSAWHDGSLETGPCGEPQIRDVCQPPPSPFGQIVEAFGAAKRRTSCQPVDTGFPKYLGQPANPVRGTSGVSATGGSSGSARTTTSGGAQQSKPAQTGAKPTYVTGNLVPDDVVQEFKPGQFVKTAANRVAEVGGNSGVADIVAARGGGLNLTAMQSVQRKLTNADAAATAASNAPGPLASGAPRRLSLSLAEEDTQVQGSLKRDVGLKLNDQIESGVPEGYAGHHLIGIAIAGKYTVMHHAADDLGYNINRGRNAIALPTTVEESARKELPLHNGRHLHLGDADAVTKLELGRLQRRFQLGRVPQDALVEEIGRIEDRLRKGLLEHEFKLQVDDPNFKPQGE